MAYRYSLLNGDEEDPQALQLTLGGGMPETAPVPLQDQPPEPAPAIAVERAPVPLQDTPQPAAPLNVPVAQAQPAQQGLSGQDQLQALLAAQMQKRDPELEQMYAAREKQALMDSAKPQYGGAELARDVLGTVPAFVLDALVNHGRGAAGIALTGAQAVQQNRAAAEAEAQRNADLAIKLRERNGKGGMDPLSAALAIGRLGVAQGNEVTNANRQKTVNDRFAAQQDPNSPLNTAKPIVAGRVADAAATGRQNALHLLNPQMSGDAANIRGAQTQAQIDATLANAPATAAAAASQAAGVETAKVGAARAAQAAGRPVPKDFEVTDPDIDAATNEDQSIRGKKLAEQMTTRELGIASQKLADIRKEKGPQWYPDQTSGEYGALALATVGAANRLIADAGTLNDHDRAFMLRLVPGIKPNWDDLGGWIADMTTGKDPSHDLNGQQLEGFAKGLRMIFDARMASYGQRYIGTQAPLARAPVVGPAQPGAGMPGYNLDGNEGGPNLGDTGGRATLGNVPAGGSLAGPDTVVTIRLNGETARVPLSQANRLKKSNPALEIGP